MRRLLHSEIHQVVPLTPVQETAASLHRTSAVLMQPIAALLATHGMSPTQYNVLRILRGANRRGLTCSAVANRLVSPDPDTTRLIDRLVRRRWVRRDRDAADRRVVMVRITLAGRRALTASDGPVQGLQRAQFKRLSPRQLQTLTGLLERLRQPPVAS
jgi:DNA-binding MarR family transcriptional regulator